MTKVVDKETEVMRTLPSDQSIKHKESVQVRVAQPLLLPLPGGVPGGE